ncbi:hypothetical protein CASFOL_040868 [Castilleja foliolosa]|uniref:Uncharacterized protein n=1 Tax=Castilleja foliolosa TaxID=1961234 RepID=A0ABD3BD24_9LAMI
MSNSSPSPQHEQQEQANQESGAVSEASLYLNQETLNQPDSPPPKSDPNPPPPLDPEYNSPDEEDDDDEEGGEIDEGQEQEETPAISAGASLHMDSPIAAHHVSTREVTRASHSPGPNTRRNAAGKRKKGKGKGKPNAKKQQAIEEKMQSLLAILKPIPFRLGKIPDFSKHENLLKKLGLWDFFHIDLDKVIRVDLIAQLIASYEPKLRASQVEGYRIKVSRADFARAFKLKTSTRKKGNNNAGGVVDVDLECEDLSDDSIGFVRLLVDEWVLLHEDDDTWMMPNEVAVWYKVIKEGHPEKVDWGSLLWFMVEKELKQGGQLRDCYYASHLQHLIKCQREELFSNVKDEIYEDINAPDEKGVFLIEGPSTELTLGDGEKEEENGGGIMIKDVDKCKEIDDNDEEEHETEEQEDVEQEQGQWLFNGQNELGEHHFMQRCSSGNAELFESYEEEDKEDEEMDEDEDGNKFHVFPSDDPLEGGEDGFTGKLLNSIESNQMGFDHQHHRPQDDRLCNQSSVGIGSFPHFFNIAGKRVIEHDSNGSNKKLRINDLWDHNNNNKQVDFEMCVEQMQNAAARARMLYEEKEQALENSSMNHQLLLSELQKRDAIIDHLRETRVEEIQKKDSEIFRLERELCLMESVLEGYRKALKDTQRVFSEYREKAKVEEEPTYKDTGIGGLMLTGAEIEKLRKKHEEYKMCRLVAEQVVKEYEDDWVGRFDEYAEKLNGFEKRLTSYADDVKGITELYEERKIKKTREVVDDEEGEKEKDEEEPVANLGIEEKMDEGVEDEANV